MHTYVPLCIHLYIIEWLELEGTPKGCLFALPAEHRDTHSSSSAHSPIPDRGCLQGWGTTTSLGTLCSVSPPSV